MSISTEVCCKRCGAYLRMRCGDIIVNESLDLTLECEDDCGAPVLNAFVALSDFEPIEVDEA